MGKPLSFVGRVRIQGSDVFSSGPPGQGFVAHSTRIMAQVEAAVTLSVLDLQAASMRVVPVLTGALRRSCNSRFTHTALVKEGRVTYHTAYAVKIHENLDTRHPIHSTPGGDRDCGGDAKYLEGPLRLLEPTIIARIKQAMI